MSKKRKNKEVIFEVELEEPEVVSKDKQKIKVFKNPKKESK